MRFIADIYEHDTSRSATSGWGFIFKSIVFLVGPVSQGGADEIVIMPVPIQPKFRL